MAPISRRSSARSTGSRRARRADGHFAKGQRKDDVAHEYLAGFTGEEGVLFVGRAQEKTRCSGPRSAATRNGAPIRGSCRDRGGQPVLHLLRRRGLRAVLLKFSSYFPYNAKLCINGNEWAKRQAAKAGIGFTALDNGFAACDDPAGLQTICDRLTPARSTRCCASGCAPAAPVHPRRPGCGLPL